jgi:hypothetical protein
MKASNAGADITRPIVAAFRANPGERMTSHRVADLSRLTRKRAARGLSELVSKGVIASGYSGVRSPRGKLLTGFWLADDWKAGGISQPPPDFQMKLLDTSILRPRWIRDGAGQAAPGIRINASVYDRSRP